MKNDWQWKEKASAFQGISTPLNEIVDEIQGRGWEPTIKWQSNQFVAKAKNPHGESLEATGPDDSTAAGNLLVKIMRREHVRTPIAKIAQWTLQQGLTDNLETLAQAYAQAPVYDPKAAPYWKELADDSVRRAAVIGQQIKVEVVPDPEPYATPAEMCQDVHKNKHFLVSSANSQHPVWTVDQNVAFRTVHDVLGHCVSGGDFGWQGELRACSAHFPLLTPNAQKALFVECIMQTGAASYYRSFMQQKVFDPGEVFDQIQQANNPSGHQGIHPTQSLVPEKMPQVEPSTPQGLPWATQIPHQDFQGALPVFGSTTIGQDPNANWESGIDPMPNNAYVWGGDPLQAQDVTDNALKIDTRWSKQDEATMKQAIVNAFRVVLLSPRKNLKWNAIHYQDLAHIPAETDDPKRYWDALESRRESWNQARGFAPGSHKPYWKELVQFKKYVRAANPKLDEWDADEKADREFMHMWNEEEERITNDPKNLNLNADEVERKVAKEIGKRLKGIMKPSTPDADYGHEQMYMFGSVENPESWVPEQEGKGLVYPNGKIITWNVDPESGWPHHNDIEPDFYAPKHYLQIDPDGTWYDTNGDYIDDQKLVDKINHKHPLLHQDEGNDEYTFSFKVSAGINRNQYDLEGNQAGKYGAFMGGHLKSIAQISQHVDELTQAALEDIKEHDGEGHHFRATALSLGIPGVGPKVASFAWLLLQPATSQLATIDTHMMDVLGHDYEKEMNNRDYFKFERELQAGRDAAGYGHVPLGQFQWGMWDAKRTGEGTHQDHSSMKVLDPTPYDQVDWEQELPVNKDWQAPTWWEQTQPARDMVADDWHKNVATQFPRGTIPRFGSESDRYRKGYVHIPSRQIYVWDADETGAPHHAHGIFENGHDPYDTIPFYVDDDDDVGGISPVTHKLGDPDTLPSYQKELKEKGLHLGTNPYGPWKFGKMTLPQEKRLWESLGPHTHETLYEYPDGWSVKAAKGVKDADSVGQLMRNCWQRSPEEREKNEPIGGNNTLSLHDEYGIPRVALYVGQNNTLEEPKGPRNKYINEDIYNRLKEFADQGGYNIDPPEKQMFHPENDFWKYYRGPQTRDELLKDTIMKQAGTSRIPWILWGAQVWVGQPGETFMNLARRQLGYSMEDVWARLPEYDFSAGSYDPEQGKIFPQDQITDLQQETILRNFQ